MIICNESRVAKSRVMSTFNRPRQYFVTLLIRYIPVVWGRGHPLRRIMPA